MKKSLYLSLLLLCTSILSLKAQMGVNSTGAAPATSSILDVSSTTKGFLMPRMTTAQRNAIPFPATGLMIFNTTTAEIEVQRGLGWVAASRMAVPFIVSGSVPTTDPINGVVQASNSGTGYGLRGNASSGAGVFGLSSTGIGVYGIGDQGILGNGTTTGVFGSSTGGTGTFGQSDTFRGVWGRGITTGDGVYGDATTGKGVYGQSSSSGTGVYGESVSGNGGFFTSISGTAVGITSTSGSAINGTSSSTFATASFANLSTGSALNLLAVAPGPALTINGALKVSGTASTKTAFKITSNTAIGGNASSNELKIPNTTLANNINDILIVTHNSTLGTSFIDKAFGVYWNTGTSSWGIFLEDMSAMPNNITFNVLVIKQ